MSCAMNFAKKMKESSPSNFDFHPSVFCIEHSWIRGWRDLLALYSTFKYTTLNTGVLKAEAAPRRGFHIILPQNISKGTA